MSDASDPGNERFPRVFGHYLLLHRIAQGGMGSVYLARRDMALAGGGIEKQCVVKTLKPSFTEDAEYIARFIDEARVVVQLSHRNICQVFDVGKVGSRHYLAMEVVTGHDVKALSERLSAAGQSVPEAVTLHLIIETLDALDYAHRHEDPITGKQLRLVHRDVSPQNVMVNFEGEVKLIDFGLAASQVKTENTGPSMVMGKLAYMAPEHARGDPVDPRSDLFACGVVAYELFAGERYYGELPQAQIWQRVGVGNHVPVNLWKLDPALQAILRRALEADAANRYPSCGDFKEALEEYRYAKGLRGGKERLRALMGELFADERETSRRLLAALGGEQAPPSQEPTEPTVTIAIAPVSVGPNDDTRVALDPRLIVRDTEDDLRPVVRRVPETLEVENRRFRPWAAALGLGALAAAAAVITVLVWPIPPAPPPVVVAPPPTPVVDPPIAAPIIPPISPPSIAVESAPAIEASAVDAGAAAPRPVPRPLRPKRPGVDATVTDKLAYLRAVCPRQACTRLVDQQYTRFKAMKDKTREDIDGMKAAVANCINTCR